MSVFKEELYQFEKIEAACPRTGFVVGNAVHEGPFLVPLRQLMREIDGLHIGKVREHDYAEDRYFIAFEQEGNLMSGVELAIITSKTGAKKTVKLSSGPATIRTNAYDNYKRLRG